MGNIALPALSIKAPEQQTDPVSRYMQMRAAIQEQQLRGAQLQGVQQENALRAQQLQDQQTIQQLAPQYIQKDENGKITGYDFDGLTNGAMAAGVRAASLAPLQTMRKNAADTILAQAQGNKAVLENLNTVHDQARGKLEAFRSAPDLQSKQAALNDALGFMQQNKIDTSQVPRDANQITPQMVDSFEASIAMGSQLAKEAQERSETAKNTAQALLDKNKLDVINSWKSNPQQVLAVDAVVPPRGPNAALNERTKSQVWFALSQGDVDSAKAAIKAAGEQVGALEKEVAVATNPQVQAGKEAVAAAEGRARAATEINTKRQETSDTQFQTAIGADERLNRMEKSYTDAAQNHNQQAMLALLTDHIGMTLGLQKGARITKDIINEAAQSQPWLAAIKAKFDSNGYLSGVNLSPGQMKQMLDLGYTARENAWDAARNTAQLYGVKQPPYAQVIYNKRDPNARIYDQSAAGAPPAGATHIAPGYTRVQASDGSIHDIPSGNMNKARQRDPGLKVLQ